MDWLDEIIDRFMNKINNLSLKKALIAYILFGFVIIASLIAVTQSLCSRWNMLIMSKYNDASTGVADGIEIIIPFYSYKEFNKTDRMLLEIIDFIQTWSTVAYSIAGIIGVSYFYYYNKLKGPLELLTEAADKVGHNDLDIEIYYDKNDEMGRLCRSFDSMRKQLLAGNQKMWDMMEEQRRINAVFAHDLRTPLTVLKGYADLLNKYVPEGKIDEKKLLSTISLMSDHIRRLENYTDTMKKINRLDEVPLNRMPLRASELVKKLKETTKVLNGKNGIYLEFVSNFKESDPTILVDEVIVSEVFDNLISNAVRYAKSKTKIILSMSEDEKNLLLSVADDGEGFGAADLSMATKAYYKDSRCRNGEHFGIGLYVCKVLCEKHKGYIVLENGMDSGAIVTAAFAVK